MSVLQGSFAEAYDRDLPWLWTAVRRLGVETRDIADVCHDVFVVAWQRRESFQAGKPFRAWLYGIACGIVANRRVRRSSADVLVSEAPRISADATPEHDLDAKQTYARILHGLNALDVEKREIFVGHDIEGLSMPELTDALGISVNTGYSRLRLARAAFEKTFREQESTP